MSAREVLTQFLTSDQPRAIALHGLWGRGKTYLWKDVVRSTPNIPWVRYSYVSLFGVSSLEDLKAALFEKSTETSGAHKPEQVVSFDSSLKELGDAARKSGWRRWIGIGARAETSWIGNVGAIYQAFVFSRIKRHLICLDDIERRGSNLRLLDVLGLVTFLCEERMCSVAVILNDSTLDEADRTTWSDHREKVFHGEVAFRPSTEDCIDLVLEPVGANRWHDAARPVLRVAGLSNVRIISRVRSALEVLSALQPEATDPVVNGLARSMAVITYCHNAVGEGSPPLPYAMKHSQFTSMMPSIKKEPIGENEQRWNSFLDEVEFYPGELESVLSDFARHGYVDQQRLNDVVRELEKRRETILTEDPFQKAWDMYHESFSADDTEDVIAQFAIAFPIVAPTVSANNANSTILLMRQLGRDDLADAFADVWVQSRLEKPDALDAREVEMFGPITDARFREVIAEGRIKAKVLPDVPTAIRVLATREGDSDLAIEAIANSSIDELIAILESKDAKLGKNAVRYVLTSADVRDFVPEAKEKILQAVNKLAEMSPLNRIRAGRLLGE
jgi:hypothetical protein